MRLQYIHLNKDLRRNRKKTYCILLPSYFSVETDLMRKLLDPDLDVIIPIEVGVSICHPEDNFNKAIGRELSYSNLETKDFYIKEFSSSFSDNKIIIKLVSEDIEMFLLLKTDSRLTRVLEIKDEK